ncbi:MAG: hypothetical protein IT514_15420 [Burkholderiales bacterium]|nr:hypothetical protein [Burkholderiales bacterium]
MAMNRAQFKKQLQDGLNTVFGLEYKRTMDTWRKYVSVETESRKAYVEDQMMAGLGEAAVKGEGAAITYDETGETYTARYVFDTIALAFAITEEAEEDGLYGSIGKKLARALARSYKHTIAVRVANLLNNGFSASYLGGDGVALFSASHPTRSAGNQSNLLTNAADLHETSLEDLSTQISNAVDDRNIPVDLEIKCMVIPTALRFVAHRLLKSVQQDWTANNATNAARDMNLVPMIVMDKRLTDTDAWFLVTDCPDGLKFIERKAPMTKIEGDFETGNMRYKVRGRSIQGWSNWRGAYGTPGG